MRRVWLLRSSRMIFSHKHFNHILSEGWITQMTLWITLCITKIFSDLILDVSTRCSQISPGIRLCFWCSNFALELSEQKEGKKKKDDFEISSWYLTQMAPCERTELVRAHGTIRSLGWAGPCSPRSSGPTAAENVPLLGRALPAQPQAAGGTGGLFLGVGRGLCRWRLRDGCPAPGGCVPGSVVPSSLWVAVRGRSKVVNFSATSAVSNEFNDAFLSGRRLQTWISAWWPGV